MDGLDLEQLKVMLLSLAYLLPTLAVSFFALCLVMRLPQRSRHRSLARTGATLMVLLTVALALARLVRMQLFHGGSDSAYSDLANSAINGFNVLAWLGWGAGLLMIVAAFRNALRAHPQLHPRPPPLP